MDNYLSEYRFWIIWCDILATMGSYSQPQVTWDNVMFLRFCSFFKKFHVRLGKKRKNVSFYRGVCMCKVKTNICYFFSSFFLHLSLSKFWFWWNLLFNLTNCKIGKKLLFSSSNIVNKFQTLSQVVKNCQNLSKTVKNIIIVKYPRGHKSPGHFCSLTAVSPGL